MHSDEPGQPNSPPLVIYGTGGSGTRVLVRIARDFGYFMGSDLNESEDSMPLFRFYERWVAPYLAESRWLREAAAGDTIPLSASPAAVEALKKAFDEHLQGMPSASTPWGWKNPRALLILPLIRAAAPRFRAIQVVRDGRDMAFTEQMSVLRWGVEAGLGRDAPSPSLSRIRRQAALWTLLNLAAANFARDHLGSDSLIIRFEDLCAEPRATAQQIAAFLDVEPSDVALDAAAAEVLPPDTIGRWRQYDPAEVLADLESGLRRFGYT